MKITLEVQTVENGELITVTDQKGFSRRHVREDGSYYDKTIHAKLSEIVKQEYERWQDALEAEANAGKASKDAFTNIADDFETKMAKLTESQRIAEILCIKPTADMEPL